MTAPSSIGRAVPVLAAVVVGNRNATAADESSSVLLSLSASVAVLTLPYHRPRPHHRILFINPNSSNEAQYQTDEWTQVFDRIHRRNGPGMQTAFDR
jgi:hypothetical protein